MSTVQSSTGSLSLATGDLNLKTQTGTITIESDSTSGTAVQINAPNAASGISMSCGSTGFNFNSTTGGFGVSTGGFGVTDFGSSTISSVNFTTTASNNAKLKSTNGVLTLEATNGASGSDILINASNGGAVMNLGGGGLTVNTNAVIPGIVYNNGTQVAQILVGAGDPNGAVTAYQGSLFLRTDGSSNSLLYSNNNNTTGWSAVAASSGELSKFQAYLSSNASNVTGDGTAYTVIFDTATFNVGSGYNTGTGVFTAPTTGKYLFTCTVLLTGLSSSSAFTGGNIQLTTTANNYQFKGNPAKYTENSSQDASFSISTLAPMTAGDTASIVVTVTGSSKTVGISGSATLNTVFSATLLP